MDSSVAYWPPAEYITSESGAYLGSVRAGDRSGIATCCICTWQSGRLVAGPADDRDGYTAALRALRKHCQRTH